MSKVPVRPGRAASLRVLPLLALAVAGSGCDIVTADFNAKESVEWRRTYTLQPGGRFEISNVNGRIDVRPASGDTVEVVAVKTARGASADAARSLLERVEIVEEVSPNGIRLETRVPRGGFLRFGNAEVRYTVSVPTSADTRFSTVNGGIEAEGLAGSVRLSTTNGGIRARGLGGPVEASTTNGAIEVEVVRIAESGINLDCTNGGIRLRVPADGRATISASVVNGGIDTSGLSLETTRSSRRRLEAQLNGGGPTIRLEGTNGGISINPRIGS